MSNTSPPPAMRPPVDERDLPTSLTFFLSSAERTKVIGVLRSMRERDRTGALLKLIESKEVRS